MNNGDAIIAAYEPLPGGVTADAVLPEWNPYYQRLRGCTPTNAAMNEARR